MSCSTVSLAQIINAGSNIENSSEIVIPGDYTKTGDDALINNGGVLILKGNLINQATQSPIFQYFKVDNQDTTFYIGEVRFIGDSLQQVISSYTGQEAIHNFIIQKTDNELRLDANLHIGRKLVMNSNNLYLNSKNIQFEFDAYRNAMGRLENESESSYIYDDSVGTGALYNTLQGNLAAIDFDDSLGIEIASNVAVSNLRVERKHYKENEVANGSIRRVFRLIPLDESDEDIAYDSLVLHYFDFDFNPARMNEGNFGPWINTGPQARWHSGWRENKSIRNPAQNFVTGLYEQKYGSGQTIAIAEVDCNNPPNLHFPADTLFICEGAELELSAEGTAGLERLWSTGETGHTISVSEEGWYYLRVWGIDGCTAEDSVFVDVKPIPEAEIGFYGAGFTCRGNEIRFRNLTDAYEDPSGIDPEKLDTAGHRYTWRFRDGNSSGQSSPLFEPVYTYRNEGTFYPQLIVESRYGCRDTATTDVRILEHPNAQFSAETLCQNETVTLHHLSDTKDKTGSHRYTWTLMPQETSHESSEFDDLPSWTLEEGGVHHIRLIAELNGCSDTALQHFQVNPRPLVAFTAPESACQGAPVSLTNQTTVPSGEVTYQWQFGNGQSSALPQPTVTYTSEGNHQIVLTATSGEGCHAKDSAWIDILPLPDVDFAYSPACAGDTVQIDLLNHHHSHTYEWTLNGAPLTGTNPLRLALEEEGSYTLALLATSSSGCANTNTRTLEAYPLPVAGFTASDQCLGAESTFINTSSITHGSMSYVWKLGTAHYSTEGNPRSLSPMRANTK